MTQMNELELVGVDLDPRTEKASVHVTKFCKDCRHAIMFDAGSKMSSGRWLCRKTITISPVDGGPKYRNCGMVRLDSDGSNTCGESGAWFEVFDPPEAA